jgi:hypothetical protein
MGFTSFLVRSSMNFSLSVGKENLLGIHHGFPKDSKPSSLATFVFWLSCLQGIPSCCLSSPAKVSWAHTFLAPFKLPLRHRLIYLKIPKECNVNLP